MSVILPTHNGEKFITNAIKSVQAQGFSDWELIIIDDGSMDSTYVVVGGLAKNDSRILLLKNEKNLGIQKSLNKGLHEARGEFIARIDDDDEWSDENKLKKQVEFLDKNSDCVLVGTGTIVFDDPLAGGGKEIFKYLNPETDEKIRNQILGKNCFTHTSVMFRKDIVLSLGGYDESEATLHVEDYDLWLRLGKKGKFANLQVHAVKWRFRENALSSKNRILQFKNSFGLVLKFRKDYPGFLRGYLRSWLRLIAYCLFKFIPILRVKYFLFSMGKR